MRIMLLEDEEVLLESLKLILAGERGITVVGAYRTGEEVLTNVVRLKPNILLTDLGLPGMSGLELIEAVSKKMPDTEIIVLTIHDEFNTVFAALKLGATGYLLKGTSPRELIEALHELHNGGAPMSPKIARAVIKELQGKQIAESTLLSSREREMLKKIADGQTYKEIAGTLSISPNTVHTHVKNIYRKLHAATKPEAISKARKKGLL